MAARTLVSVCSCVPIAHLCLTKQALRTFRQPLHASALSPLRARLLSTETRAAIDKAVAQAPVVLFMKGTPETPQCGFSRASLEILSLQGVNPAKFVAFNVLEDQELRQGMCLSSSTPCSRVWCS